MVCGFFFFKERSVAKLAGIKPKDAKESKPKIIVYGKAGVGKTWASIDFPGCYYVDTEGGANRKQYRDKLIAAGATYMGPEQGSQDFNTVVEQAKLLATTKHKFKTLIIDSYTKLYNTSISDEYAAMQAAGRDMTKTFGAEKKPAINNTRKLVGWLDKMDMNVILICHEKDQWLNGDVIGQTFDGWEKLEYELDLVLRVTKQGASRKSQVKKTRIEGFEDGELFDWSYLDFADKYGKEVIEGSVTPIKMATEEQLSEVEHWIETVNVPEDVIAKWLKKAKADDFSEMSSEAIQKCIEYLIKKVEAKK